MPIAAVTSLHLAQCFTKCWPDVPHSTAPDPASIIAAILTSEPPALTLDPLSAPALDRLLRRCLAKDPEGPMAVRPRSRRGIAVDCRRRLPAAAALSNSRAYARARPGLRRRSSPFRLLRFGAYILTRNPRDSARHPAQHACAVRHV